MSGPRVLSTSEGLHPGAFAPVDWGLFTFAAVVWGASFLFIAEGLEALEPGVITLLRILFGCATLAVVPRARVPIARRDWTRIGLLGLCWMAFPLTLFPLAEERVSSSLTGMLNGAMPVFAALVASVLLRRLPGPNQRLGLFLGLVGVVLIGWPALGDTRSSATGVLLILAAVSSYGVAINIAVPLQQTYGSLPVLWRTQSVALVLCTPYGLAGLPDSRWDTSAMLCTLALGVGGTALAFVAAATLAGRVGGTRASMTTYLMPPVSILLGVIFRDETVAVVSLVGCAVVLAGAYLAGRPDRVRST